MNSEDRFWLYLVSILGASLCILVVGGMLAYNQRLRIMTQAGYEEGTLPGTSGTSWVRATQKP